MRFCEVNKETFESNTIEESIKKIDNRTNESNAVNNYKTHFRQIYKKVGECLNIKFERRGKDKTLSDKLKEEFNKYLQEQKSSQQISSQGMTREQGMVKILGCLNYKKQEIAILDFKKSTDKAKIFFVEVDDDNGSDLLQYWIVNRLGCLLTPPSNSPDEPPRFIPVKPPKRLRYVGLEEFFETLQEFVVGAERPEPLEDGKIIDTLFDLCQSRTVVIALYGVKNYSLIDLFVREFWMLLMERLPQHASLLRGRLVMVLTCDQKVFSSSSGEAVCSPVHALECLTTLTGEDIKAWWDHRDFSDLWCRFESDSLRKELESMKQEKELGGKTRDGLERICRAFGFEDLERFREFWQLNGDIAV